VYIKAMNMQIAHTESTEATELSRKKRVGSVFSV
ncbi:MAG: hypothetical protein ACI9CQ_003893, partial [Saprospiraceae bacterium]